MWVDDSVGSWKIPATASQGFASAAKAIAWMDRHMKLWHTACAQCTVKRRPQRGGSGCSCERVFFPAV